jgi:hypothetical protein
MASNQVIVGAGGGLEALPAQPAEVPLALAAGHVVAAAALLDHHPTGGAGLGMPLLPPLKLRCTPGRHHGLVPAGRAKREDC